MPHIFLDVAVHPAVLDSIRAAGGVTVDVFETPEERTRALPEERIAAADILFCTFPPSNFEAMRRLRWIQIASVGYAQLFGLGLVEKGIAVSNARGCFDVPIAEWNMAMMVNLARDLRTMIRHQEAGIWDRGARFQSEIRGRTVGIWGYGGIGRETARLARAMGMRVHVQTRNGVGPRGDVYAVAGTGDADGLCPHRVFRAGEEMEFLGGLDFLIVAMPLTPATQGRIGERELRALPPAAFVLNPARGPIVEEQALLRALAEGWIAGAALDTHYAYPLPAEHPLWRFPNVILTPHISGSSLSTHFQARLWDIFAANLKRYQAGAPLLNRLTERQLNGE